MVQNPATGETFPLSNCLGWGERCGKEAADAFCRSRGYEEARLFSDRTRPGKAWIPNPHNRNHVCRDTGCGALTDVECVGTVTIDYDRRRR